MSPSRPEGWDTPRRPGAGQSTRRASRGWHPETIARAYLVPGERVVLEETRSVRAFLVAQAPWLALLAVGFVAVVLVDIGPLTALAALVAVCVTGYVGVLAVQASFTRYVVTDLRILRVSGVLNRKAEFIPWGKVTDIVRSESLVQWLSHTATIRIESANERSGFRSIDDVDDPDRFYRTIVQMVDRKQGRIASAAE